MSNFILGVCASLLATAISYGIVVFVSWKQIRHLEGCWFQEIPNLIKSPYSIGQFAYNKFSRKFSWDGTNYTDTGEPVAYWQSFHLHADLINRKILYIFGGRIRKPSSSFNGFGVMDLQDKDGKGQVPIGGYFQDARREPTPREEFQMTRIKDVADRIGISQGSRTTEEYHSEIVRRYHKHYKENEHGDS